MTTALITVGHRIEGRLQLTEDDIVRGATFLGDGNPMHHDPVFAERKGFGGIIACGPHISGIHACMLPTHCVELGYDVLGTMFTVRYLGPVYADQELTLRWTVSEVTRHRSGGQMVDWAGTVTTSASDRPVIAGTGQLLLTAREEQS